MANSAPALLLLPALLGDPTDAAEDLWRLAERVGMDARLLPD
jgi:hypothetical protein